MVYPKSKFYFSAAMVFYSCCSLPALANADLHIAVAQMTGNDFYTRCRSGDYSDIVWCLGYITGMSDGIAWLQIGKPDGWIPICIPQAVTIGQKKDVVLDYISKNPATRHEIISAQTMFAWRSAWPCLEKN